MSSSSKHTRTPPPTYHVTSPRFQPTLALCNFSRRSYLQPSRQTPASAAAELLLVSFKLSALALTSRRRPRLAPSIASSRSLLTQGSQPCRACPPGVLGLVPDSLPRPHRSSIGAPSSLSSLGALRHRRRRLLPGRARLHSSFTSSTSITCGLSSNLIALTRGVVVKTLAACLAG
jgi:hypothetical protein